MVYTFFTRFFGNYRLDLAEEAAHPNGAPLFYALPYAVASSSFTVPLLFIVPPVPYMVRMVSML